jgi:hypothetical protein
MAWTPGLALDYARALRAVIHPRSLSWLTALKLAIRYKRRSRAESKAALRTNPKTVQPTEGV